MSKEIVFGYWVNQLAIDPNDNNIDMDLALSMIDRESDLLKEDFTSQEGFEGSMKFYFTGSVSGPDDMEFLDVANILLKRIKQEFEFCLSSEDDDIEDVLSFGFTDGPYSFSLEIREYTSLESIDRSGVIIMAGSPDVFHFSNGEIKEVSNEQIQL